MNLEIIVARLSTAGLGVPGQTLFAHFFPPDIPQGIMVRSPLQGIKIDHYLPGFYCAKIQVIVRAQSQVNGEALAKQVMEAMQTSRNANWTDGTTTVFVRQSLPETLPVRYPRSDGNGIEWSMHFDIVYSEA